MECRNSNWKAARRLSASSSPHPGEMAPLCGISIGEVLEDPIELCKSFAATHHVVCVLKGARTVISDGGKASINETGNSSMA